MVMYKKLSYGRGTARRVILVSSCYVSSFKIESSTTYSERFQSAKVTFKVIQRHLYDFLLVFHCNYDHILHRF